MFRLPNDDETRQAMDLVERAYAQRRVITLSYLKHLKTGSKYRFFGDAPHAELPAVVHAYGRRPVLDARPSHRTGQPIMGPHGSVVQWTAAGEPFVDIIEYSPSGSDRPAPRTVRLDRVIVKPWWGGLCLRVTSRPFRSVGTGYEPSTP